MIARADDSSGIIGDACRRLLELHPQAAAAARTPVGKLIDWMMKFQFDDDEVDYFELDPVAYAPALGEVGMAAYRKRLAEVEAEPRTAALARTSAGRRAHSHEWFTLDWNAQRLAVLDHDIEAIIRTHAKDRKVAAWLEDTAEAFEEIGEIDLAIDWAKQATDFDRGHQSLKAADYWCGLLEEHRPSRSARRPTRGVPQVAVVDLSGPAAQGRRQGVARLPRRGRGHLAASPSDAVLFALLTLKEPEFAWNLAHSLALDSDHTWSELVKAYEKVDPLAVLPIHQRLVENELVGGRRPALSDSPRGGSRRCGSSPPAPSKAAEVDDLIADLRETHRRRPRLQQEFDRAGLP